MRIKTKRDRRHRISLRLRKRIGGTPERPRLAVFPQRVAHLRPGHRRPGRHHAGLGLDDRAGLKAKLTDGAKAATSPAPRRSARPVAERLKAKGITRVVFDRGGFLYHGRVKAVADAAREAGLEF
jgi:large subunit ribosomal protein L18